MKISSKSVVFLILFSFILPASSHDLKAAIESHGRSTKNMARDEYRNPYETLSFFEIKSNMKVIELSPGGGWYTEILANYLHEPGILIAAHFDKDSNVSILKKAEKNLNRK